MQPWKLNGINKLIVEYSVYFPTSFLQYIHFIYSQCVHINIDTFNICKMYNADSISPIPVFYGQFSINQTSPGLASFSARAFLFQLSAAQSSAVVRLSVIRMLSNMISLLIVHISIPTWRRRGSWWSERIYKNHLMYQFFRLLDASVSSQYTLPQLAHPLTPQLESSDTKYFRNTIRPSHPGRPCPMSNSQYPVPLGLPGGWGLWIQILKSTMDIFLPIRVMGGH